MPPYAEKGEMSGGGGNNLTMNHSFRSRASTMNNPSQISVIQSQNSHHSIDDETITQGSVSNRMSFKDGRGFPNVRASLDNDDEPSSPGLNSRKLRR